MYLNALFAAAFLMLALALVRSLKFTAASIACILGVVWVLYSPSIFEWVEHLGSDSFSEAQNFDLVEAIGFFESLDQVIRLERPRRIIFTLGVGIFSGVGAYWLIGVIARRLGRTASIARPVGQAALLLIAALMTVELYSAGSAFRSNSELYEDTYNNFHSHGVDVTRQGAVRDLKVVIYIGESTSALNMGIYGYPRLTTPELAAFKEENPSMFVFHNVFAPHVHTAPSLLEALSIGLDPAEDFLPIAMRKRVSIIDVLTQAGIPSLLVSNQGSSGTWNNLASTVIFGNVTEKEFSFDSVWLGELEHRVRRPLDHEFLVPALDRHGNLDRQGPEVIFLHSYAGHSPHFRNIDERFKQPVDDFLEGKTAVSIVGGELSDPDDVVSGIERYDSTIRYIDHCVTAVLDQIKASKSPAVFIYFADHGDAVYAGRNHDSSRFLHEMARIPFIVYFNDVAARRYPSLVDDFRGASDRRKPATLAQFPASLLSMFGLRVTGHSYAGVGQDETEALPPILTRETGAGFSYVRLGARRPPSASSLEPRDETDGDTELFLATLAQEDSRLCRYGINTIGKALRGAIVADCLWVEMAAGDTHIQGRYTAPAPDGQALGAIVDVARSFGRSLWISGKNLKSAAACRTTDSLLEARPGAATRDLVMFPSDVPLHDPELRACLNSIRSKGVRTAIEVPREAARHCSGNGTGHRAGCAELSLLLEDVAASRSFTDLAFDHAIADSIRPLGPAREIGWNAWNITLDELDAAASSRFSTLAIDSGDDPNEL